jgi:hypothetical protein
MGRTDALDFQSTGESPCQYGSLEKSCLSKQDRVAGVDEGATLKLLSLFLLVFLIPLIFIIFLIIFD